VLKNPADTDQVEYMDDDSEVETIASEDEKIMDLDYGSIPGLEGGRR
jgi:hypothetical protein